jgi:tetratricopeptide (TPR) repeat protein
MNKMKKVYFLMCIFLCGISSINSLAQDSLPDSLFNSGAYENAALEYERILFLGSQFPAANNVIYKKAQCYKSLKQYKKAYLELARINYFVLPDSVRKLYKYESALLCYLNGDFEPALSELLGILTIDSIVNSPELDLLYSMTYNELHQWDSAYNYARKYLLAAQETSQLSGSLYQLDLLYSRKGIPHLKKQKVADVLQMFPGLGQAYAGSPGEGLINFLLNAGFLGFGAYQIWYGYYITGYFVGAIGLNKVYFGGHARTEYLLNRYNYRLMNQFRNKYLAIIHLENNP